MNKKQIRKNLQNKFYDWVNSIGDKKLGDDVRENCVIAGGAITSLLLGEKVNDYDIYLQDRKVAERLASYYIDLFENNLREKTGESVRDNNAKLGIKIVDSKDGEGIQLYVKSAGVASSTMKVTDYEYFEGKGDEETSNYIDTVFSFKDLIEERIKATRELDQKAEEVLGKLESTVNFELEEVEVPEQVGLKKYQPVFITSNAITLTDQVQVIFRFIGNPNQIVSNYDYIHCTSYWNSKSRKLVLKKDAILATLNKTLVYVGSKYPVTSLFRMRKFMARGWVISAGQILKIALQISDLDLRMVDVLKDQVIGVDVAYFADMLSRLESDKSKLDENKRYDSAYLIQVIDEVFDD